MLPIIESEKKNCERHSDDLLSVWVNNFQICLCVTELASTILLLIQTEYNALIMLRTYVRVTAPLFLPLSSRAGRDRRCLIVTPRYQTLGASLCDRAISQPVTPSAAAPGAALFGPRCVSVCVLKMDPCGFGWFHPSTLEWYSTTEVSKAVRHRASTPFTVHPWAFLWFVHDDGNIQTFN